MKKWITIMLMLGLIASGCSSKTETKDNEVVEATQTAQTFPLIGLPTSEKTEARPIAVMYNNHPVARPQSGLNNADIVYEVLAEGDITRFLAIFQSSFPETFGPIRSARDYYIELAQGYRSLFINHGHSPEAKQLLDSGAVDALDGMNYDGKLFKRDTSRRAPHNSYLSYNKLIEGASMNGFRLQEYVEPLEFTTDTTTAKQQEKSAANVEIQYSSSNIVRYKYNESKGNYTRYNKDVALTDRESGQEIVTKNIFIVYTEHTIQDDYGRRDVDLVSGGEAMLINNGNMQQLSWKNVDGRILPYNGDTPVAFAPGKIWIQIVPTRGASVSVNP